MSERELFDLCVARIRELDARARAALAGIRVPPHQPGPA